MCVCVRACVRVYVSVCACEKRERHWKLWTTVKNMAGVMSGHEIDRELGFCIEIRSFYRSYFKAGLEIDSVPYSL